MVARTVAPTSLPRTLVPITFPELWAAVWKQCRERLLGRILQKLLWERPWGLRPTMDSGRWAEWMSLDWCGRNVMVVPSATAKSIQKSLEVGRGKGHLVRFLSRRFSHRGGTEWFLSPLFTLTLWSVLESVTREFLVYLLNAPALPDLAALWKGMRFL